MLLILLAALEVAPVEIPLGDGGAPVLMWPLVIGDAPEEVLDKINGALDYPAVTGETREETRSFFEESGGGIVGAGYTVNRLDAEILDLTIRLEHLGAYPSTLFRYFTFDAATGERLTMADLAGEENLDRLAEILDGLLQRNIREARAEAGEPVLWDDLYRHSFTREDLDLFSVIPGGILFHYDFGFPHAALALEPEGDIFLEDSVVFGLRGARPGDF
jgi:hypothetical protein